MNFSNVLNKLKAKAPEILVGAGVVGIVTGTVMACKASKKVDDILEEHNERVEQIHHDKELGVSGIESGIAIEYPEKMAKKDLTKTYLTTAGKLIKLYLPSALVMTGSIGCILGSYKILNERNAALAAAYTTLDTCYKDYRANVVEKYGEDVDKEMAYGIKAEKQKEGEEKSYKITSNTNISGYARLFDEMNPFWEDNAEYNFMFLTDMQRWANDRLKAKGVLFLNDVYEALGFPETQAGQVIGWVYDPQVEAKIDFGLYNLNNQSKKDFMNGLEKCVLLDFNVDGDVHSRLINDIKK